MMQRDRRIRPARSAVEGRASSYQIGARVTFAAVLVWTSLNSSTSAAVPNGAAGLTCKAAGGATVRLNLDLAARRFQKEGFPSLPIEALSHRRIILMHQTTNTFIVTAAIDRDTLDYVAASEDLKTHERSETRYVCAAGPPFGIAAAP